MSKRFLVLWAVVLLASVLLVDPVLAQSSCSTSSTGCPTPAPTYPYWYAFLLAWAFGWRPWR